MSRMMTGAALGATVAALGLGVNVAHARPAAKLSGLDEQYLTTAIEGDRFEIAGGRQALAKSQNAKVRALATRLVQDHTKSLKEARTLARRLGVKVPKSPSPSMQWELDILNTLSGATYDRWYADLEVKDHTQDIQEAADEVKMGSNAAVVKSARKEIPILREHKKMSREALAAAGG
jgi:putative membrane protein